MKKQTPEEIQQKRGDKLGKAISKILGKDTQFVLVARTNVEDGSVVKVLHNANNRIELLGMLEHAKTTSLIQN